MPAPRIYQAASVPRFLRITKLGYLPLDCVIGNHFVPEANGGNLVYDVIMLEPLQFQRMRTNMGMNHIAVPVLKMGPLLTPTFSLVDLKEVTVPANEPDPRGWARNYFIEAFGLTEPMKDDPPELPEEIKRIFEEPKAPPGFTEVAKECTGKKD